MINKTIFVTGGVGLIGSEVSKALASQGAKVIILDVNQKAGLNLAKELGNNSFNVEFEYFDIGQVSTLQKNIQKLFKKYGRIDAWVNAAYPRTKDWNNTLDKLQVKSWRKNIDTHLNGYCLASHFACQCMKKQKSGTVVNFASIYGIAAPDFSAYKGTTMTMPAAYAPIKGGIIAFSRYLAAYYGKYNIRVNIISPGGVNNNLPVKFVKKYTDKTLLKRMAQPQDIAAGVVYLVSDAGKYITGHNLVIDGGWSVA